MTRNVTITLPEDDLRWAKVEAAKQNLSLSRFVGSIVEEHRRSGAEYWKAFERWKELEVEIRNSGAKIDASQRMTREEAHER